MKKILILLMLCWVVRGQTYIDLVPNPHTDTLKFVCSATNAITYQWYIADTAVTGETDSVITIYADSAFYASKPTVYCVVSNGINTFIGFSWTFVQSIWNRLIGKFHTGTGMF